MLEGECRVVLLDESKSSPQLDDNKAPTPWVNLFKDNRNPSKSFGMKFSPPPSDDEVLLEETDF